MKNKFKQIKLIFYTFNLIGKCCKKHLFTIVFLSVVNSIFPIISLLLPQGIFNMAQQKIQPFNEILKLIIIYVIFILVNICLSNLYSYQLNQLNLKLGYKIKLGTLLTIWLDVRDIRVNLPDVKNRIMEDRLIPKAKLCNSFDYNLFQEINKDNTALINYYRAKMERFLNLMKKNNG